MTRFGGRDPPVAVNHMTSCNNDPSETAPRTTLIVVLVSLGLIGLSFGAGIGSAAEKPSAECHPNFPGGHTCTVQAGGCTVTHTSSPYGDDTSVSC